MVLEPEPAIAIFLFVIFQTALVIRLDIDKTVLISER